MSNMTNTVRFTHYADAAAKAVTAARDALYVAVGKGTGADSLVHNLNELAAAEAAEAFTARVLKCWTYYLDSDVESLNSLDRVERVELAVTNTRALVTDALLSGADDSWSGRGNEVKRAAFDGLRSAARRTLTALDFN